MDLTKYAKGKRMVREDKIKKLEALNQVEANPTLEGEEETLESLKIGNKKYVLGGGTAEYKHSISFKTTLTLNVGAAGEQTKEVTITLSFINKESEAYTISTLKNYDDHLLANCSGKCVFSISGVVNMRLFIKFYSVSTNYVMYAHGYNATDTTFYDFYLQITQANINTFVDTVTEA